MRLMCQSCTSKQIDLQTLFVTTTALLCQNASGYKSAPVRYKCCYYLTPPRSVLTKQI